MQLNQLMNDPGEDIYYDPQFHVTLFSLMPYLRSLPASNTLYIEPAISYKYEGDLYGLLGHYGVPKQYHHATMIFNGYRSSNDFNANTESISIPDINEISLIKMIANQRQSS